MAGYIQNESDSWEHGVIINANSTIVFNSDVSQLVGTVSAGQYPIDVTVSTGSAVAGTGVEQFQMGLTDNQGHYVFFMTYTAAAGTGNIGGGTPIGQDNYTWTPLPANSEIGVLPGGTTKNIYFCIKNLHTSKRIYWRGHCTVAINNTALLQCTAPASVTATRTTKNNVSISWSASTGYGMGSVTGYAIIRNTAKSTSSPTPTTVSSNTTTNPFTNTGIPAGDYYFGVRAQSSNSTTFNSNYTWSGKVTVPPKPSVSTGDEITKTNMDDLKTWLNGSQTSVTQGNKITATVGTTYRSASADTEITASWYNAAT